MTVNGWIAVLNAVTVAGLVILGLALLWQARRSLRTWPVSALVALAGPYLLAGAVIGHVALWRVKELPGQALDRNGIGTLALRLLAAAVTWALVRRIATGRLLTGSDRRRIEDPG